MYTHIYVDTRKLSEIINAQFLLLLRISKHNVAVYKIVFQHYVLFLPLLVSFFPFCVYVAIVVYLFVSIFVLIVLKLCSANSCFYVCWLGFSRSVFALLLLFIYLFALLF